MNEKVLERISPFIGLLVLGIFILLVVSVVRTSIFEEVEEEKHIYFEIVFLLLLAVAGEIAVIYTKQPSVMLLMVHGVLVELPIYVMKNRTRISEEVIESVGQLFLDEIDKAINKDIKKEDIYTNSDPNKDDYLDTFKRTVEFISGVWKNEKENM